MDVRGKLIALAGIILSAFIIYLIVKYRNYNLSNPVLFENINQTKDITTTNKNEKYKATVSLKNAEKSLEEAQRNNYSVQDIEDAKEAVRAAKSRIKMYMSKDGEKITNVPSLPMNLTYSLLLKFKIKNNSNAFEPYCIFFRGNDIDNGSPSLWWIIARANIELFDGGLSLKVGKEYRIPIDLDELGEEFITSAGSVGSVSSGGGVSGGSSGGSSGGGGGGY